MHKPLYDLIEKEREKNLKSKNSIEDIEYERHFEERCF